MELSHTEIRVHLQIALLGEIYPKIKAIAYAYDPTKDFFLIRYYLRKKPTDDDYDNISSVMAEFISNFKYSKFNILKEECEFSTLPISKLDPLDGFVYASSSS